MSGYLFKPLKIRAFICIKNYQLEDLMEEIMFTTTTKNINCLGIKKNVQGLYEEKKKSFYNFLLHPKENGINGKSKHIPGSEASK